MNRAVIVTEVVIMGNGNNPDNYTKEGFVEGAVYLRLGHGKLVNLDFLNVRDLANDLGVDIVPIKETDLIRGQYP